MGAPTQDELLEAIEHGNIFRVQKLLEGNPGLARARFDHGKTPLHWAAELDDANLAHLLLAAGAQVDARADWGHTPLMWAANCGSVDVAEMLLAVGDGGLDLWTAAALGKLEELRGFWSDEGSLRADVEHRRAEQNDDGSWAPAEPITDHGEIVGDAFYIAGRNGHVETMRFLLERGADVDHRGFFGGTALHWAALLGHAGAVTFLLDHGADPSVLDEKFEATPAEWALEGQHEELAAVLEEAPEADR